MGREKIGSKTKGVHHVGLTVRCLDEALNGLFDRLKADNDAEIEFAPEFIHDGPTRHMMCNMWDGGVRIEFIAA